MIPTLCWSQGQITRPKKTEPVKKETQKQTSKQPQPAQSTIQPMAPNNSETINGITVYWATDVTANQKYVITNLLNNMVFVQGGSFMMGSNDSNASDYEKPVHRETVNPFRIDKYEVTQQLWQTIMGNNPSYFKGDILPVERVSWVDCQNFIKKLNRLTGLSFRLPTEAEWEYAARGGNKSKGYKYSGSNTIEYVGWYGGNSSNATHPVGLKNPNELGLYDMSGNVWELTSDKFSLNYNSPRDFSSYVRRGACFLCQGGDEVLTHRGISAPNDQDSHVGLRLVL